MTKLMTRYLLSVLLSSSAVGAMAATPTSGLLQPLPRRMPLGRQRAHQSKPVAGARIRGLRPFAPDPCTLCRRPPDAETLPRALRESRQRREMIMLSPRHSKPFASRHSGATCALARFGRRVPASIAFDALSERGLVMEPCGRTPISSSP